MTCSRPHNKGFYPSEILRFEPQVSLGRKGHFEKAHLLVLSQKHVYPLPEELQGAPSVHEDFTLRPAPKSQGRQVTSATLSCLGENRPIYFSSPESERVCICFRRSCQVSLGKAFRKTYDHCKYSSSCEINLLVGITTKQTCASPPE